MVATVDGLPRSSALPARGSAPSSRPRKRTRWTGSRGAKPGATGTASVACPPSIVSHSYRFASGVSITASARALWNGLWSTRFALSPGA